MSKAPSLISYHNAQKRNSRLWTLSLITIALLTGLLLQLSPTGTLRLPQSTPIVRRLSSIGCFVKGITTDTGDRLYYLPSHLHWHHITSFVSFCSEDSAVAAGYTKSPSHPN